MAGLESECRRQVTIRKEYAKRIPRGKLLSEPEWRELGIHMSHGWEHYCEYRPQSNVLLFRRPIGTDGRTGHVDPELAAQMKKKFRMEYGLE
ncbi:hypothetical protein BLSTO_03038 [Blastocystis sp. subtype 1]